MRARHVLRWVGASSLGLALGGCIERKLECPSPGPAATVASAPASAVVGTGVSLVGAGGLQAFALQGDTEKVTLTTVPVTGQTFREALRARITRGSGREWAVQLRAPTAGLVAEGDVLLATFYLRADEPLEDAAAGQTQFVFEQARDPYTKSVTYDVEAGRDWREVHVPFVAKQTFAPGEAQMVFRLGYDPETIEIGGVIVEDFGKKETVATLPRTRPWSPPKEKIAALPPVDGGALAVEVAPSKVVGPISPYVYGVSSQRAGGVGVTVRRMGGNRQTAYNWEINASNAGTDYENSSDDWPCAVLGYKDCDEPAGQILDFYAENERLGVETVATIPMVDYVAADKKGQVSEAEKAPSPRWDRSIARKNGPYAASPDTTDRAVYEDELVEYLVRKLGKASRGGIRFYSLDNEPGLWPQTHPRVHPEKTTYREMVTRTEAIASQITAIDPSALVLGGVMYGWSEYQTLHDAPDAKDYDAQYGTYVDYFLSRMEDLEKKYGRRLVHLLDVHWYPEARGTKRVTEDDLSPKTVRARVEAPRAL